MSQETHDHGTSGARGGRTRRGRRRVFGTEIDESTPVYMISVAAELTGLHPQTLRTYDRLGLVSPDRTGGGGRRYSVRDIRTLRHVTQLSAEGIGLEGVRRILELEAELDRVRGQVTELENRLAAMIDEQAAASSSLIPPEPSSPFAVERLPRRSTAVVLWRRRRF